MAVGPTESLNSGVLQMPPEQVQNATRAMQLIVDMMRGLLNARINPSSAIPPSGQGAGIVDRGIGSSLDVVG